MSDKIVEINPDNKNLVIKALEHLIMAASQMRKDILNDELKEEFRDTVIPLLPMYTEEVAKYMNYQKSDRDKEFEEGANAYLNEELKRLKAALQSTDAISKIQENMKEAATIIESWWGECGFHYVKEATIDKFGMFSLELGFDVQYISMCSETPETDKERNQAKIAFYEEEGLVFFTRHTSKRVADCDSNRKMITEIIKKRFPSARILHWTNSISEKDDQFILTGIELLIRDASEVVNQPSV